ncbi:MAG: amidohydrolase family protein [Betaproteobacteria bacterium]|nr:amidohydrolase family protein [Betaproteobacteria bacterium]
MTAAGPENGMAEWISLTHEAPVDPARRIIDAHHHLWAEGHRKNPNTYSGGNEPAYLPANLHADIGKHNVIGSVFVECGVAYRSDGPDHLRAVGETEFVAEQARLAGGKGPPILGIVADADIARTDVLEEVLDAHVAAGSGLFVGIRQMPVGYGRPMRDLLAEPEFRDGIAMLGARGFTFDAMLGYSQLKQLAEFAPKVAQTTLIVDHLGAPNLRPGGPERDAVTAEWKEGIRALMPHGNVVLKIGGIGMERAFGMNWSQQERPPNSDTVVERWQDEIRFCIDTLGPDRCMFESNYPVDRLALGYTVMWNAFQKIAARYSDAEQDALFSGTACNAYNLRVDGNGD